MAEKMANTCLNTDDTWEHLQYPLIQATPCNTLLAPDINLQMYNVEMQTRLYCVKKKY